MSQDEYKPTILPAIANIPTRDEILAYCEQHAATIAVRACIKGEWQWVYLSEVPREAWDLHIQSWFLRCMLPNRVRKESAHGS